MCCVVFCPRDLAAVLPAQACWRNATLNNEPLSTLALDPLRFDLPRAGILSLDYVSYDVPTIRNADLLCKLFTPRTSVFRVKPEGPRVAAYRGVVSGDGAVGVLSATAAAEAAPKGAAGALALSGRY